MHGLLTWCLAYSHVCVYHGAGDLKGGSAWQGWCIQATKDKISLLMNVMRADEPHADFRFAFVGYRDYNCGADRIISHNFTDDMDALNAFLQRVRTISRANPDFAEDVAGGLKVDPPSVFLLHASSARPCLTCAFCLLLLMSCWLGMHETSINNVQDSNNTWQHLGDRPRCVWIGGLAVCRWSSTLQMHRRMV